jgi:RHS repeat-associated protein
LFTDWLGSTRLVTDEGGAPKSALDYSPFGVELQSGLGGRTGLYPGGGYPATGVSPSQRFTSKERDSETGLDFFGARYFSGAQGRFTSVDPLVANLLRVLNPQRWNMYAYAVNNPLVYTDPDGRDALVVQFATGAHGLGHAGVASLQRSTGKGRFADFQPLHAGSPHDVGRFGFDNISVTYGSDGKPTKESLVAVANQLADDEQVPRDSVSVAYFKTSDTETAALEAYIGNAFNLQQHGETPDYWVGFRDCISFTQNGMARVGKYWGTSILSIPNLQFLEFWLMANETATGTSPKPDPEKDRKPPHKRKLVPRCQENGTCDQ